MMASKHSSKAPSEEDVSRITEKYGPHVRVYPLEDAERVPGTKQVLFRGCSFNLKYSGKSRGSQQTFECTKRRSLGCTAQVLLFDDLDYALMKYGHNHGEANGSSTASVQWSEGMVPRPVVPISKSKPSKPTARRSGVIEKATAQGPVAWEKATQRAFLPPPQQKQQQPAGITNAERLEVASRLMLLTDPAGGLFVRALQLVPDISLVCSTAAQLRSLMQLQPEYDVLVLDLSSRNTRRHGEMLLNLALWHGQTDSVTLIASAILGNPSPHSYRGVLRELVRLCPALATTAFQLVLPFLPQLHSAVATVMPYASLHGRKDDLRACLTSSAANHQHIQKILSVMECLSESNCSPEMWTAQVTSLSESVDPSHFQLLCSTWLNSDATFSPTVWAMPTPRLIASEAGTRRFLVRLRNEVSNSDSIIETVQCIQRVEAMQRREPMLPSAPTQLCKQQSSPANSTQHPQSATSSQSTQQALARSHAFQSDPSYGSAMFAAAQPYSSASSIAKKTALHQATPLSKAALQTALQGTDRPSSQLPAPGTLPRLAPPESLARQHSLPPPGGHTIAQKHFEASSVRLAPIHFRGEDVTET